VKLPPSQLPATKESRSICRARAVRYRAVKLNLFPPLSLSISLFTISKLQFANNAVARYGKPYVYAHVRPPLPPPCMYAARSLNASSAKQRTGIINRAAKRDPLISRVSSRSLAPVRRVILPFVKDTGVQRRLRTMQNAWEPFNSVFSAARNRLNRCFLARI